MFLHYVDEANKINKMKLLVERISTSVSYHEANITVHSVWCKEWQANSFIVTHIPVTTKGCFVQVFLIFQE